MNTVQITAAGKHQVIGADGVSEMGVFETRVEADALVEFQNALDAKAVPWPAHGRVEYLAWPCTAFDFNDKSGDVLLKMRVVSPGVLPTAWADPFFSCDGAGQTQEFLMLAGEEVPAAIARLVEKQAQVKVSGL